MPFPAFYSPHGAEELFCMAFPAGGLCCRRDDSGVRLAGAVRKRVDAATWDMSFSRVKDSFSCKKGRNWREADPLERLLPRAEGLCSPPEQLCLAQGMAGRAPKEEKR
jgi:hypothetical protein